jgi:hypothetical protein
MALAYGNSACDQPQNEHQGSDVMHRTCQFIAAGAVAPPGVDFIVPGVSRSALSSKRRKSSRALIGTACPVTLARREPAMKAVT